MANAAIRFNIFPQSIQEQIHETLNWHSQTDRVELTKREQEVLQIMSMAWDDEEAAKALNISLNT
ncbi:MAG: DNA-binding response regulator, partial [Microcystaceae cyanobacterium]